MIVFIIVFIKGILLLTNPETSIENARHFSMFACSTPDQKSHRAFDYTFYLLLTALAWQRIGFESTILIIGEKSEWMNHSILSYTLVTLNALPHVTVLFISANVENRAMLSQTARIYSWKTWMAFPVFPLTTWWQQMPIFGHWEKNTNTYRKEWID